MGLKPKTLHIAEYVCLTPCKHEPTGNGGVCDPCTKKAIANNLYQYMTKRTK